MGKMSSEKVDAFYRLLKSSIRKHPIRMLSCLVSVLSLMFSVYCIFACSKMTSVVGLCVAVFALCFAGLIY